jgi:hypothetical protein
MSSGERETGPLHPVESINDALLACEIEGDFFTEARDHWSCRVHNVTPFSDRTMSHSTNENGGMDNGVWGGFAHNCSANPRRTCKPKLPRLPSVDE